MKQFQTLLPGSKGFEGRKEAERGIVFGRERGRKKGQDLDPAWPGASMFRDRIDLGWDEKDLAPLARRRPLRGIW